MYVERPRTTMYISELREYERKRLEAGFTDPIECGTKIFAGLLAEFGDKPLRKASDIERFLERLLHETDGLVIVDFLDTGNWDQIQGFDLTDGILTLYWHDYRGVDLSEADLEARDMLFSADLRGLGMAVNSIAPLPLGDTAIFLLNGHARTLKEIKTHYRQGSTDLELFNESFFEKRVVRRISDTCEVIDFHSTPIYSLAILPKNLPLTSSHSRNVLLLYNLEQQANRIAAVTDALRLMADDDVDLICEKANTARRVMESVLKLEVCYRDSEFRGDYSQKLGPLMKAVRETHDGDPFKELFALMATLLNEFSHDSGKPVRLGRALPACTAVQQYTDYLRNEITKEVMGHATDSEQPNE